MLALTKAEGESFYSLFRSTNNGQSWQFLRDSLTDNVLVEEQGKHLFVTEQHIYRRYDFWSEEYVNEIHPVLVRSTDQGASWKIIPGYGTVTDISSNNNGGLAVGFSKSIYNQGTTTGDIGTFQEEDTAWRFVPGWRGPWDGSIQTQSQAVNTVAMLDDNSVIFSIYAHGDGGLEKLGLFRLTPDDTINTIHADFFVQAMERTIDGSLIAAIDVQIDPRSNVDFRDRGIYRSTDNGNSWTLVHSTPQHYYHQPIFYLGPNGQTFFLSWDESIHYSTDYGTTWNQVQTNDSVQSLKGFVFHPDGSIFSHNHHSVFFSVNNGKTWTPITNGLPSTPTTYFPVNAIGRPQSLAVSHNGTVFCGIKGYGIYQLDHTTSVKERGVENSTESLRFIASNSGEQTAQFSLQETGTVTLKLYDITGREVRTILDEHRSSGDHQIQFSLSELVTGTYLLVLTTEQQTKSVRLYR